MAKRRVGPTDGWATQSKVGTCRYKLRDASKPSFIRGENISLERGQPLVFPAAAGRECAAHSQAVEGRNERPDAAPMVQPLDRDHRRDQDETLERTTSGTGSAEKHGCAHRMRESDPRTGTFALQDIRHERVQVGLKPREVVYMSLVGVAQRPIRPALAAPIHRDNGKAARQQFADNLEILLDELAAAAENNHCSDRRRRRPSRSSQRDAVGSADIFLDRALRRGIVRRRGQCHGAPC